MMKSMKKIIFGGLVASTAVTPLYAEEEMELFGLYGGEDFISIATGSVKPIAKAPAVASIITSDDLKRLGARDVDEALEQVPGLHVSRNTGYQPVYTFRGIYSGFNPQVLMLINGIPVTNLFQGDRNQAWGGMPVESISRIEIIRGPGSALYGADAFAGVINIITKSGGEIDGFHSGIRYGSFDTKEAFILYGKQLSNDYEVAFSAEYSESDGHEETIRADAQSLIDAASFPFFPAVSLAPGDTSNRREMIDIRGELKSQQFTARLGYQYREVGTGVGVTQALDPTSIISSSRLNVDATYTDEELISGWRLTAQLAANSATQEIENDIILFPAGSTGPGPFVGFPVPFPDGVIGNPEVYERHYRANVALESLDFTNHQLRIGLGYYLGDVYKTEETKNFVISPVTGFTMLPGLIDVSDTPLVFLPEDDRENTYGYVQDVWQLANDWELTLGVRYDDYSDFGSTTNPRAALVWSARHDLTVKALYGEAFRAPSFAETRVSSNPAFLGNPDLDPETLKSYELAFDYRPRHNLTLNSNFFYYKWEDIIQFVPILGGGGASQAENRGEQTGHGLEFEVSWDATDDLTLSGNFSWQKSTDENLDADAANSPEKQLYVRADWDFAEHWNLNLQSNWVMDRNRAAGDPRSDVDDYVLVDLTLRRTHLWKNWEVALLVKNLFDEDAREPSPNGDPVPFIPDDLPLAGRSILGELRYQF
jgi:iron complex outermembrane receptor protein